MVESGKTSRDGPKIATAGKFNAGKLLPPNLTPGENRVTAMDTVGIIRDATEEPANTKGTFSKTADIVGTREIEDAAEKTGAEKLRELPSIVDPATTASDVLRKSLEEDTETPESSKNKKITAPPNKTDPEF